MKQKVKFEESETIKNLVRAFAAECQDGARYQFLAKQAEEENLPFVKMLLKKLAKNEMSHAKVYHDLIMNNSTNPIKNIEIAAGYPFKTTDNFIKNFKAEIDNEANEGKEIYPGFARVAEEEGFPEIAKQFGRTAAVERCHNAQLNQIYDKLNSGKLYKSPTPMKWKCDECGFEDTLKEAWSVCPLCAMGQGYVQVPLDQGK